MRVKIVFKETNIKKKFSPLSHSHFLFPLEGGGGDLTGIHLSVLVFDIDQEIKHRFRRNKSVMLQEVREYIGLQILRCTRHV